MSFMMLMTHVRPRPPYTHTCARRNSYIAHIRDIPQRPTSYSTAVRDPPPMGQRANAPVPIRPRPTPTQKTVRPCIPCIARTPAYGAQPICVRCTAHLQPRVVWGGVPGPLPRALGQAGWSLGQPGKRASQPRDVLRGCGCRGRKGRHRLSDRRRRR